MEYRLTVSVKQYGRDPHNADVFLKGFYKTHPEVGAVADQDTETGILSVTILFDAPDDFREATEIGGAIWTEGANASGLPPTEFVQAHLAPANADEEEAELPRQLEYA